CASLLLPESKQAEWLLEWESELWHVRRLCAAPASVSWQAEREIAIFCLGAFQDAHCLRKIAPPDRSRRRGFRGSAASCITSLAGILIVCYLLSLALPGVRLEHALSSNQVRPGTILIQDVDAEDSIIPTMHLDQLRDWKRIQQRYIDDFAFYR